GQPAAVSSMLNRQQPFGADVITRVSATMMDESALGALQQRAHETFRELTGEVLLDAGVAPHEVYEIAVCGNVTMMQIALGIDPEPLSMAPFTVATHEFPPTRASDFGVALHPRASAYVFPSLGAYVGGDIVAGMLATGLTRDRRLRLFIDVGTNSEIALGIDPEPLSMAPFTVATHTFPPTRATEFGVTVHPRASAYVFPSLGAYVGGDIVSGMLATGLTRDRRLRLFIDVGTNSEIALGSAERVLATAAPAGPAFEAAQIKCGMRAADGAIEGIKVNGDSLDLEVIGDVEPVGMCGSGLVDAVAELVHAGLLDHSGRFIPDEDAAERFPGLSDRLTKIGAERVFVLHWRGEVGGDPSSSIYLSQRDVRELQFAKGSIATGWQILVREMGIDVADISQVLLAGSFGAYLSPLSAVRIGLVPRIALPRIVSAGNVAGEGAKIAALSLRERAEAESILREVEYVELSGRADFNDLFIDQLAFPG
ncbi:MAG TPA: ASKHA domain-containing protein, partial [Solirubrobacteraceae bacterium]